MEQAKSGDMVRVHYTGRTQDGDVFDSSEGREFTIGEGRLIPGFESAVIGMQPGDSKTAEIPADEGYGPRSDEMIFEVDRDRLPEDMHPQVGEHLQLRQSDGRTLFTTVADVGDQTVTLDANHPLAGRDLAFDIELVAIL